jgi:hypothetical protein
MAGEGYAMRLDQNRARWQYSSWRPKAMTFETIDAILDEPMMTICEEPTAPAPNLRRRLQPWLEILIGVVCLTQGVRFMLFSDSIATLVGLGLLTPIPTCFYLAWRDFLSLKESRRIRPVALAVQLRQAA